MLRLSADGDVRRDLALFIPNTWLVSGTVGATMNDAHGLNNNTVNDLQLLSVPAS